MTTELWFNRPVMALKTYTLETVLGEMWLKVYPAVSFQVYGELQTVINRIPYTIHVNADLDLRFEDWHMHIKLTPNPTKKALDKAYTVIKPLIMEWLDSHPYELFAGHSTALASQLERANHKLDNIIEQVKERREVLARMKAISEQGGMPPEKDIEMLMNLYDREWTFR